MRTKSCVLAGIVLLIMAGRTRAQVDCSVPDNLCTGDPCVIPTITVASPCTTDFGTRTLTIAGTVTIAGGADITWTAGSIMLNGALTGVPAINTLSGITLTATNDITLNGNILLQTNGTPLSVEVDLFAGGDIAINSAIRFPTHGGGLGAQAGGTVTLTHRVVAAAEGTALKGSQGVFVKAPIFAGPLCDSTGNLFLTSSGGPVVVDAPLDVRPLSPPPGGCGVFQNGGLLQIEAAGDVTINKALRAGGLNTGGGISLKSDGGNVILNAPMTSMPAGLFAIKAAGSALLNRRIAMGGRSPFQGFLGVVASAVTIRRGTLIQGSAPTGGGLVCLSATAGDLNLSGMAVLHGGTMHVGAFQASATGNTIADGAFRVGPNGCLAFTASGTVDTSHGFFDRPLSADCGIANICAIAASL